MGKMATNEGSSQIGQYSVALGALAVGQLEFNRKLTLTRIQSSLLIIYSLTCSTRMTTVADSRVHPSPDSPTGGCLMLYRPVTIARLCSGYMRSMVRLSVSTSMLSQSCEFPLGTFVRLGPNHISVADPDALEVR
jgi:hypothetical protein